MKDEPIDSIDPNKVNLNVPGQDVKNSSEVSIDDPSGMNFDFSAEAISASAPVPTGHSVLPSGVSLTEFLEYGMVPVEDLEAELAAPPKHPGIAPSTPKGKYYTVYSRAVSTGSSGTGSQSVSIESIELNEEDQEEDDEDEDDDSEETDL